MCIWNKEHFVNRKFLLWSSKETSSSTKGSKSILWLLMKLTTSARWRKWLRQWPSSWSPRARNRQLLQRNRRYYLNYMASVWSWPSGKLPFECQKITKNLTFFFKKIAKNYLFFPKKFSLTIFVKKMTIFEWNLNKW